MPSFALQTSSGEHLGFLLQTDLDITSATSQADCILTGFPSSPALSAHPLSEFLQHHKHIEFLSTTEMKEDHTRISITIQDTLRIELSISMTGQGIWSVIEQDTILNGNCIMLPPATEST